MDKKDSGKEGNKRPNHEPHNSNAESSAHQQPLYMCFVDFKKAFDSVSRDKLWITMMEMGYPLHLMGLLAKLYKRQVAKVKVAWTLSESVWPTKSNNAVAAEAMKGYQPNLAQIFPVVKPQTA